MLSRRQRFREFMAAVNGAADPADALRQGQYIEPPGARSTVQRLVPRLELDPTSTHLVIGGIGSGKTTQLLVAEQRLRDVTDIEPIYVDLSRHQDLDKLQPGSLVALAGVLLGKRDDGTAVKQLANEFNRWAHGYYRELDFDDLYNGPPDEMIYERGVVTPPSDTLSGELAARSGQLAELREHVFGSETSVVLLIDSLDRLSSLAAFETLLTEDLPALRSAGIGVVLVGPLRAMYGLARRLADCFDHVYRQPVVDISEAGGRTFLQQILERRAPADMLDAQACERIVHYSGGVLRDLMRLAHQGGDEAYVSGADRVEVEHVERAADAFGRTLMLGLESRDLDTIREVHATGRFVETSEHDLALLVTRRILDYVDDTGKPRYAVHPTLEALLAPASRANPTEATDDAQSNGRG